MNQIARSIRQQVRRAAYFSGADRTDVHVRMSFEMYARLRRDLNRFGNRIGKHVSSVVYLGCHSITTEHWKGEFAVAFIP